MAQKHGHKYLAETVDDNARSVSTSDGSVYITGRHWGGKTKKTWMGAIKEDQDDINFIGETNQGAYT